MRHSDTAAHEVEDVSSQPHQNLNVDPLLPTTSEPPALSSQLHRSSVVQHEFEMDDSAVLGAPHARSRGGSSIRSVGSRARSATSSLLRKQMFAGMARHTLGLILLLIVVFLWTLSNFLGSSIFADASYAKPFFLTYLNTSIFVFAMVPTSIKWTIRHWRTGTLRTELGHVFSLRTLRALFGRGHERDELASGNYNDDNNETEAFIKPQGQTLGSSNSSAASVDDNSAYLGLVPTAQLSFAFCILWFGANYFAMACLQHATVASATILTSTSSIWTLLIGALTRTEKFTWRKLCGVLASLAGIILISHVDLSSPSEPSSPSPPPSSPASSDAIIKRAIDVFPDKPAAELALGDGLALLSAIIYGFYTITLKKSTIKADPLELHMPTFFGLVGLFNIFLLLPLFPVLHYTGIETFQMPPNSRIWTVLIANSISSFASDIMWAYAMVFTSPLLVTVGLSLTIPLSLIGEMVVQARYEGWMYWIGAMVVVGSFVFVEREEVREEEEDDGDDEEHRNVAALRDVEEGAGQPDSVHGQGADRGTNGNKGGGGDNEDDLADLMDDTDDDDEDDATRGQISTTSRWHCT